VRYALQEAARGDLYHITGLERFVKILEEDRFLLGSTNEPAQGASPVISDRKGLGEPPPPGRDYFLSTARSTLSVFIRVPPRYDGAWTLLVLDGDALANRYTVRPVHWTGGGHKPVTRGSALEFEERVWSRTPVIPKASSYIREVHILIEDEGDLHFDQQPLADFLEMDRRGIPLYAYRNREDFWGRRKNNAISDWGLDRLAEKSRGAA